MAGDMEYIRKTYGVPAKRGGVIEYTDPRGQKWRGTIRGASGGYLRIQLDGIRHTDNFHPTWNLVYRTTDQGGGE